MTTILPDFTNANFEPGAPIDNQYFPLALGTVLAYEGAEYETAEIIEAVAGEIGNEIAEEIIEELGREELPEIEEGDLIELADEIEDELEETIDEIVDEVIEEIEEEDIGEFDGAELAEAIKAELIEDVTEELTGEEIESEVEYSDAVEEIIDELDDGIDELAVEIAEEITEVQADLFATESNQVFVTGETKTILGVETTVIRDVGWDEGVLVEDTFDWYAQDTEGNVWYLGEIATNYEYDEEGNFIGTNTDSSWEAGVDGALPGYLMPANPQVGDTYYQEFYPGEAEDEAEVISLNETVSVSFGDFTNVLQTREFTQLEPEAFEYKYFAPGIGQILAEEGITQVGAEPELAPDLIGISDIGNTTLPALSATVFEDSKVINNPYFTLTPGVVSFYNESFDTNDDGIERHEVEVTEDTKDILGVTSLIVKDSEYDDNVLTDEKLSYYAQDSDGNVWLMGETVTEYEYDEAGSLIDTDDSDSWLAGEGEALPGLIMSANPQVGEAYYQRFDIGDAENQAEVVETDLSLEIGGETFEDLVKIKEFSVLEPEEFDFKYYAPGTGLILEEEINPNGEVIFTSSLQGTIESANKPFIDLLDGDSTELSVSTVADSAFDNIGGFYQAIDTEGTVIDRVTGAEVFVGDTGYESAAVAASVAEFGETTGETLGLDGGFVYVPYLLADGQEFLTGFADANVDGINHVQASGDSNFAFEDLVGGGDNDFNDFIISVETV